MKALFIMIIGLIIVLLASYFAISQEYDVRTYVVRGDKENVEHDYEVQTFVIEQKPTGKSMLIDTVKETKEKQGRNVGYQQIDEDVDRCIEKITKNWERVIDGKVIYGYDEDEDFSLRWRLRNKALNGEKVC